MTEKDLAEDAPWKKIQQNTFTRWCNEHLKCVNKRIGNLQTDLSDGLRLIALLEVLSQKHMYRKYHQRPTFRQMQLENVSVALEFLDRESIKLVSIGEYWAQAPAPLRARERGLSLGPTRGEASREWRTGADPRPVSFPPGLGPGMVAICRAPRRFAPGAACGCGRGSGAREKGRGTFLRAPTALEPSL